MTASDIAAWWGAILATLVLGWDIYKWQTRGPRLYVRAHPNMKSFGDDRKGPSIFVEVVNRGDSATTVTHLGVYHFASPWRRLLRRRSAMGIVASPGWGPGLPFEIAPGQRWTGAIDQQQVESHYSGGVTCVAIAHSGSSREVLATIPVSG